MLCPATYRMLLYPRISVLTCCPFGESGIETTPSIVTRHLPERFVQGGRCPMGVDFEVVGLEDSHDALQ